MYNKDVFDKSSYIYKISWWEKMLLFFRPATVWRDGVSEDDRQIYLYAKKLFGKTYIVDEKYF